MSCISSNFSSFFLNSLNDPSEFSKYLSNGELRFSSTFEDFPVYGQNSQQQQQQQYQQQQHIINGSVGVLHANGELDDGNSNIENTQPMLYGSYQTQQQQQQQTNSHHPQQQRWITSVNPHQQQQIHIVNQQHLAPAANNASATSAPAGATTGSQHFDGSFEFMKYLRHSNDYNDNSHDGQNSTASNSSIAIGTKPDAASLNAANAASLMDLDNAHKRSASRKTPLLSSANSNHSSTSTTNNSHPTPMAIDMYDHDSKHTIFDLHHMNSVHSSNSNESSMELSSMTYPNSHLNASNSNTSSEGGTNVGHSDFSMLGVASTQNSTSTTVTAAAASPATPKPLASFSIKDNFDAHPSHKVEEGIFQHMNKLPSKKKDTLKQLGVRFTGQMTLNDKSIIVENFIKFCQEYDVSDHRPFLSLNQSGLNKPDQIKFARYLGQGLPTFTLFCIYSNFKNLFCTKRTEIYTKDGYNLPYILDKTKRFLANTTAGNNNNNNASNLSMNTNPTTATTTTATASSSNINSLNTNSNPNNTTTNNTTTTTLNNNSVGNNAVAVVTAVAVVADMQNGNSNSSSSGGSGSNVIGNNNNDTIINTPTKQIHNVPSPAATPRAPQIQQQMPQIPIQNTPLPAHPPTPHHPHTMTPQTQHQKHVQQHPHLTTQQQQHHHHHIQMPMSPMMGSPLPPPPSASTAVVATAAATVVTQSTTNHHQLQQQHPHHMQPNNHLNLHPHPPSPLSHHVRHLTAPLIQQHPEHATAATSNNYQQQQMQQQQHHQQQQIHHPLHNLAAQNPPL